MHSLLKSLTKGKRSQLAQIVGNQLQLETATKKLPFRKTLWWKFTSLLTLVSMAGGAAHFFLFWPVYRTFDDFVEQVSHWSVASEIEFDLRELLNPKLDKEQLIVYLSNLERIDKRKEIYILAADGTVIFSLYRIMSQYLPQLSTIESFLEVVGTPSYPIPGENPRFYNQGLPFSVAKTTVEGKPGYVYVILRGGYYNSVFRSTGDYSAFVSSGVFLIGLVILFIAIALVVSVFITKRFRRITNVINEFAGGNYQSRIAVDSDDEIALHASTFNKMADIIQENIVALEDKDRLRRELVANISHDLRTPIAVMQGLLESLHSMFFEMPQEQREDFLQTAIANCHQLNSRIEELFELSRLNSTTEQISTSVFAIDELLMDIVSRFSQQAKSENIKIRLDIAEDLPLVRADTKLLDRALGNLIENALRYSGSGSEVVLSAHPESEEVKLAVADNGSGVAEQDLPHLFDRFYRGSRSEERSSRGTGLGLAITKRIFELHNKNITVESTLGQGTTFRFSLAIAD